LKILSFSSWRAGSFSALPTVPAQKDAIDQPVSGPQSFYHMSLQKATTTPKIVLETFALLLCMAFAAHVGGFPWRTVQV